MKNFKTWIIILTIAITGISFAAAPANAKLIPANGPDSFADTVEGLIPAVVNISSTQKLMDVQDFPDLPQFPEGSPFEDFFEEFMERRNGMPMMPQASLGSGFVIDGENGYIITNNHVVKDAEEIRVTFQDEETLPAELIGTDEKTDLAVLKVETDKKLVAVEFGDSDPLRVGDWIVAIGNPFGLGGTVTAGIVSARQRDINAGPYDDFIQTDASINRGNSGGPMFDVNGKVIGINTAIFSPSGGSVGIGFAIPTALAKPVIDQIIEYGRTRRGWLGVRIQQVTEEIAESLELPKASGALVATITPDGPASESGLEPGDIILEINGRAVKEMRELPRLVAETPIDSDAIVTYWRDGKKSTTKVKIGELEKAEDEGLLASGSSPKSASEEGLKIEAVGVSVKKITDVLRREYGIPRSVEGVAISNVDPRSEAAKKGMFEGDVIVEINQQPVSDPEKAVKIIEKAQADGRPSALLLINREGEVRFLALKLKKPEEEEPETGQN